MSWFETFMALVAGGFVGWVLAAMAWGFMVEKLKQRRDRK